MSFTEFSISPPTRRQLINIYERNGVASDEDKVKFLKRKMGINATEEIGIKILEKRYAYKVTAHV